MLKKNSVQIGKYAKYALNFFKTWALIFEDFELEPYKYNVYKVFVGRLEMLKIGWKIKT